MPQPTDALDFRRAHESVILDALAVGHPLALAEAYHRAVPAAHAVARRLMSGADAVEALLLKVFGSLWTDPPTSGPLEGWVRRQTWAMGVESLRESGTAPASPSAAGLLPDLPAPDVRFLDAAERAIAELAEDERRALLLAHDKGVPTTGQEPGSADALTRALMALAGPENSTGDRAALHEDGCDDLDKIGDWCLGVASAREHADVATAIEERPGCAAKSRATRRGRRRIEGLPATPDMGQRILVTVLSSQPGQLPATAPPAVAGADTSPEAGETAADPAGPVTEIAEPSSVVADSGDGAADAQGASHPAEDPTVAEPPGDAEADDLLTDDRSADDEADPDLAADSLAAEAAAVTGPEDSDPFDALGATGPLPALDDHGADATPEPSAVTGDDPFRPADAGADDAATAPAATTELTEEELVAAGFGDEIGADDRGLFTEAPADARADDSEDLFAETDDDAGDWRPDPGSTAELRLSDILAEGEEDDPFAELDDAEPTTPGGDPYAALGTLEGTSDEGPAFAQPESGTIDVDEYDEYGGYVEGEDPVIDATRGGPSALTTWVLPAIVGIAGGLIVAILVLGLP
ncbi:RNA polymerase sigma factor [Euzebya tangerina]|uniref:RNA polymerase sigma factor n=1 Tax=Euzebya tangerina TaxID=591198 RepID=UPI000E30DBDD|nr:hypothetical protein [Euzebya tangerina]